MKRFDGRLLDDEKISALVIFIVGMLVYYQMAVEWLTNPDTVWNALYVRVGHGSEKNGGRLLQIVMDGIRCGVVNPVLMLMISVFILTLISVLLGRIFEITSKKILIIIGLLVLFMPCTSSTLTFYFCSDSFQLAFFCVVAGVYIIKNNDTYRAYAMSLLLFTMSLFFYQAYICIAFSFGAIFLILDSVKDNFVSSIKKTLIIDGMSGISCILYIILFKLFRNIFDIEIQERMSFESQLSLGDIWEIFKKAGKVFADYFFTSELYNNNFGFRSIINICVWIIIVICVTYGIIKKKDDSKWSRIFSAIAGLLLIPWMTTAIQIMAPKVQTTVIMLPTMVLIYILPLALCNILFTSNCTLKREKIIRETAIGLCILLVWNLLIFTNLCISSMKIRLNKTETVAYLLLDQVMESVGYNSNYKLLISGAMEDGNFRDVYEEHLAWTEGTYMGYGYMWHNYYANEECWVNFLKQYCGIAFQSCTNEEYQEFINSEIYEDIPIFPETGSVLLWNEMIVVKMSDVRLE